jgi:hypothetical protein
LFACVVACVCVVVVDKLNGINAHLIGDRRRI